MTEVNSKDGSLRLADADVTDARHQRRYVAVILLIAASLRAASVTVSFSELSVDRDAYLQIAGNLIAGHGYCSVPDHPTAFRPPLYPLFVAACLLCGGYVTLGIVHVLLGTATVGLTVRLARNCGISGRAGCLAAILVAVDPLLLKYTALPMTETLFVFLTTALLVLLTASELSFGRSLITAVVFGSTALCRPTVWAFGLVLLTGLVLRLLKERLQRSSSPRESRNWKVVLAWGAGLSLVTAPWAIRNYRAVGKPVALTTHGGYTLLLSNNPVFYRDVVEAEWGTTWSASALQEWQESTERKLTREGIERTDEPARDAAMRRQAIQWMRTNPGPFIKATVLRVRRFWNPFPLTTDSILAVASGCWNLVVMSVAALGLFRMRSHWHRVKVPVGLVVGVCLVHSIYWSNARMRAPLIPCLAVFASAVVERDRQKSDPV